MAITLTNTANLNHNGNDLLLSGAYRLSVARIDGESFVFVSTLSSTVQVLQMQEDGTLLPVGNVSDDADLALSAASGSAVFEMGGVTYLAVSSEVDDGVSLFSVAADGSLTHVDSIFDSEDVPGLELNAATDVEAMVIGARQFLVVAGHSDDGLQVLEVESDGTLIAVSTIGHDGVDMLLDAPFEIASLQVGGNSFVYAASRGSSVSVFSMAADGTLTHVQSVADTGGLFLSGANAVEIAGIGSTNYLFAGGIGDTGVSVFSIDPATGELSNTGNFATSNNLQAHSLKVFEADGVTYLAAGAYGTGLEIFTIGGDGSLASVLYIPEDQTLNLRYISDIDFVSIDGRDFLTVVSFNDHGVSMFEINASVILGDGVGAQQTFGTLDDAVDAAANGDSILVDGEFYDAGPESVSVGVDGLTITLDGVETRTALTLEGGVRAIRIDGDGDVDLTGNQAGNVLRAGYGDDILLGRGGDDILRGMRGRDQIEGGAGNDTLRGVVGADVLRGGGGDDTLSGGRGRDELFGGAGNDILIGGGEKDMLTGGNGSDVFVIDASNFVARVGQADLILDFQIGRDGFDLRASAVLAFADGSGAFRGDTIVTDSVSGDVLYVLRDISADDLIPV